MFMYTLMVIFQDILIIGLMITSSSAQMDYKMTDCLSVIDF